MAIGGGFKAVRSVIQYTKQIGPFKLWKAVNSKNACKACAFGTGGQNGGLKNEKKQGIEICNKNIQAHLSDIRQSIPTTLFFEQSIQDLSKLSAKSLEDLGRLVTPLYKKPGDQHFTIIDYDQALKIIANKLSQTAPEKSFFYASGRSSNEAAFLMQLFARLFGTNHINNCSYFCHQASGVGLQSMLGTSTSTVTYDDLYKADTIVVWGANPASNHPRFVKTLLHCRRRGGNVIVINPAKEPGLIKFASPSDFWSMIKGGESVASHYIQPHIGGDFALATGIIKALLENQLVNAQFIEQYTTGSARFIKDVEALAWKPLIETSGQSKDDIIAIAKLLASSQKTLLTWGMGVTHHKHGVQNIQSFAAMALLLGQIGQPGCGLLPLRGHSNIQGTGSMGFTPGLKQEVMDKLEDTLNLSLPKEKGYDTMGCMEAAHRHDMEFACCLGGNLLAANPDREFAEQALDRIPFKLFISPTLNISHVNAVSEEVVILPIRVRDEEHSPTTQESMFNYVRMSNGGIERFTQLKSEVDIISALGHQVIDPQRFDFQMFKQHKTIRETIANIVPGFDELGRIDETKKEFHIEKRIVHSPQFQTLDQKAHFPCLDFTPIHRLHNSVTERHNSYRLTSVRSEGQFNSIIFHEHDAYREQTNRWVVLMNPVDMKKEDLKKNDHVTLFNQTGTMEQLKVQPFDVKPGNLMVYYPEANILIPRDLDTQSKTPSFKSVEIQLQKSL